MYDIAFATLTNLINPTTGTFATTGREISQSAVQQRLDTVANAMTACDDSSGDGACTELFSCARANARYASTGQPCTGGTTPKPARSKRRCAGAGATDQRRRRCDRRH